MRWQTGQAEQEIPGASPIHSQAPSADGRLSRAGFHPRLSRSVRSCCGSPLPHGRRSESQNPALSYIELRGIWRTLNNFFVSFCLKSSRLPLTIYCKMDALRRKIVCIRRRDTKAGVGAPRQTQIVLSLALALRSPGVQKLRTIDEFFIVGEMPREIASRR